MQALSVASSWSTKALVPTVVNDVPTETEGECLAACYRDTKCEAVSFKKGSRGGCWLRKAVKGVADDASKDSYILCEGERAPPLHLSLIHI